jgi:hypothetical protein
MTINWDQLGLSEAVFGSTQDDVAFLAMDGRGVNWDELAKKHEESLVEEVAQRYFETITAMQQEIITWKERTVSLLSQIPKESNLSSIESKANAANAHLNLCLEALKELG